MDILEGVVTDVADGAIDLEVERVIAGRARQYRRHEIVRLAADHPDEVLGEDAAARAALDWQRRRVRLHVVRRDADGRLVAELERIDPGPARDPYGLDADGE
jgi:hypothetical protein